MKAVVFSLGCKTNRYESDAMSAELRAAGWLVSENLEEADVYIINTCAVTTEAEKKSRQAIARVKHHNANARIFICGCASENKAESFQKNSIEIIIGTAGKNALVQRLLSEKQLSLGENGELQPIKNILTAATESAVTPNAGNSLNTPTDRGFMRQYEEFRLPPTVDRTRAALKIQDGCNNFCAYCIIPYLRGRSRSRKTENILKEVEYLASKTKEIVLTGINLSAYGTDIGTDLPSLIRALSPYDVRIRLGSFYVEGMTDELLVALRGLKHFCPQFHLSLQSGDDAVLSAMNRKYNTSDYKKAVNKIRNYFPNAGITTDVIVGFPTETEEQFANTLIFLAEVGFSDIHSFVYSERDGTAAAKLKDLTPLVKAARKERLILLTAELKEAFLRKNIGMEQDVLMEEKCGELYAGYSGNYLRVYSESAEEIQTIIPKSIYKDGLK